MESCEAMIACTIFTSKLTFFLTYLPCTQIASSTHGNDVKFCGCSKKLDGVVEIVHRKGSRKVWAEIQVDSKAGRSS